MPYQPVTGETIRQLAFVTRPGTFDATVSFWTQTMGVGPFYVADFRLSNQVFRGMPADGTCRVGLSFQGDVQLEIIEPTNGSASPYLDVLDRAPAVPTAGLFHHFLIDTADYEGTCQRLLGGGATEGLRATLSDGRRMTYLDAMATIGCYIEVIEGGSASAPVWARMRQECARWDGSSPVRSYHELVARASVGAADSQNDPADGQATHGDRFGHAP
jgi:methylmalonyl-CoA/ethylmalonyl-CoA epimerase